METRAVPFTCVPSTFSARAASAWENGGFRTIGEYADVRLHAGLVCINASGGLNLESQKQLFTRILDDFEKKGDLINQVMEVDLNKASEGEIRRRSLPTD